MILSVYDKGSGSRINLTKSKGLWLGSWRGRVDPPVSLDWTSSKMKVLGIFLGPGNLDEDNWRPRIQAVENALSRVWYVASLVHMPPWLLNELNKLAFNFFWKGKKDLVAPCVGGFSVADVKLKVQGSFFWLCP